MDSSLILIAPILLTFSLSSLLLSVIWLTISCSCPTITIYNSISAILVSPLNPNPKVVTAVNGVITSAFSGIVFNFFYRNRSSNYVTKPYRKYYGGFLNRLGI